MSYDFKNPLSIFDDNKRLVNWAFEVQPKLFLQRTNPAVLGQKSFERAINMSNMIPLKNDIIQYSTRGTKKNKNNFYKIMGSILLVGQMFGQLPVRGLLGADSSQLKFKWLSWQMLFTSLSVLGGTLMAILTVLQLISSGYTLTSASSLVFYGSTYLTTILFFRLSQHWPSLSRSIEREESRSISFSYIQQDALGSKFKFFSFFFLFTALAEHIWCLMSGFTYQYGCGKHSTLIEGFFRSCFPQAFAYTTYSLWKGILLQIYNTSATFNWIYMDLFIILLSSYIVKRFDNLNSCIKSARNKNMPEEFWKATRVDYANLARLVGQIDANVNELTLLSFANNLYIICMQLFNSFNTKPHGSETPCWKALYNGIFTTVYYVFSFAFLFLRFLAVSLSASRIYESSRASLNTLFLVSSESYCTEVQRFIEHVTSDTVAFSGMKFFYITKGLILTIAGTIVTYELVLVQFNQPAPSIQANITVKNNCGEITDTVRT